MRNKKQQVVENGDADYADDEVNGVNDDDICFTGSSTAAHEPTLEELNERREIRHQYRQLLEDVDSKQQELANPENVENDELFSKLRDTNNIFLKVTNPREAVLDSHMISKLSTLIKQRTQALHTDLVTFQPVEFAMKLKKFMVGDAIDVEDSITIADEGWEKFGKSVQSFFRRTPPLRIMYGSFDREAPVKKVVNRNKEKFEKEKEETIIKTVPKQLSSFGDTKKTEKTTEEVEWMLDTLKEYYDNNNSKPICFFEFIINPFSFGKTVENMFHCSFLVKDGHVKLFLDEDKLPVIEPVHVKDDESDHLSTKKQQIVMTMTKPEWEKIIKTFQIMKPLLKTRDGNCS